MAVATYGWCAANVYADCCGGGAGGGVVVLTSNQAVKTFVTKTNKGGVTP